jgi:hypothetical protein
MGDYRLPTHNRLPRPLFRSLSDASGHLRKAVNQHGNGLGVKHVCAPFLQVTNTSLTVTDFSGLWFLLLGMLGLGFIWALGKVVLVKTLARYPALRETFIKWTRHVAKAGKRFDLLLRITSKRAGGGSNDARFNENPVLEEEKVVATLERSASGGTGRLKFLRVILRWGSLSQVG